MNPWLYKFFPSAQRATQRAITWLESLQPLAVLAARLSLDALLATRLARSAKHSRRGAPGLV